MVWATNHFKYYLQGAKFELITDHTALLSALKPNRANKSRQSRLIRWVDKLLPYNFSIKHLPGKDMGFTDYLSRNPHLKPPPISPDDELFVINRNRDFTFTLLNEERKHSISANQNAPFGQTHRSHVVIIEIQRAQNKANAFLPFLYSQAVSFSLVINFNFLKLKFLVQNNSTLNNLETFSKTNKINPFKSSNNPKSTSSYNTPYSHYSNPRTRINVVTRNKPNFNTYDRPIVKRARKPNKKQRSHPLLTPPFL